MTMTHPIASALPAAPVVPARDGITPSWTLDSYARLLTTWREEGLTFLTWEEFRHGAQGIWLRHDVELCSDSAVRMAEVENQLGVQASYFLCWESPVLADLTAQQQDRCVQRLERLGHLVGLHAWHDLPETAPQWCGIDAMTFHQPRSRAKEFLGLPTADEIYGPVVNGHCTYLSDSTGRWHEEEPAVVDLIERRVQLLIHPYWWSAGHGRPIEVTQAVCAFLPQVTGR